MNFSLPALQTHFDVCIMQPSYLPWLGYFDLLKLSDVFIIYDDVQFDKGGWRNRNRILINHLPSWLTVPVNVKGKCYQLIKDATIVDTSWQKKHLKAIECAYKKAPYFDWCHPALETYLTKKTYTYLLDLNIEGLNTLCGLLSWQPKLVLSSDLGFRDIGKTERLVALSKHFNATRYISPNASENYMDAKLWQQANITLCYQNYPHPTYKQYQNEFAAYLSVVDALMFVGKDAVSFFGISHTKKVQ